MNTRDRFWRESRGRGLHRGEVGVSVNVTSDSVCPDSDDVSGETVGTNKEEVGKKRPTSRTREEKHIDGGI